MRLFKLFLIIPATTMLVLTPLSSLASETTTAMTELDTDCNTLRAFHDLNLEQIDKVSAVLNNTADADGVVDVKISPLGQKMGAGEVTAAGEMLALLNGVRAEQEAVLGERCAEDKQNQLASKHRTDNSHTSVGERVVLKRVQTENAQNASRRN